MPGTSRLRDVPGIRAVSLSHYKVVDGRDKPGHDNVMPPYSRSRL